MAISLVLIGWLVQMTQAQVQWFESANKLQPDVNNVQFIFDPNRLDNGSARVTASINNPSDNPSIRVFTVEYTVFVNNSTMNGFSMMGSSQVAISISTFSQAIPAQGNFNLSSTMALMPDVVLNLHDFITKQPNYVVWVLINVNLDSSYGTLALQSCFQQPSHLIPPAPSILIPTCPAPRSSSGGGGGGG